MKARMTFIGLWLLLAGVLPLQAQTDTSRANAYRMYEALDPGTYRIRFSYTDPFENLPPVAAVPLRDTVRQKLQVIYLQSAAIELLAQRLIDLNQNATSAEGYRIQLFSGDRGSAGNVRYQSQALFPDHACYLDYERPYFKVRLGDFFTRPDAEEILRLALETWPGAFIVPSTVNIQR